MEPSVEESAVRGGRVARAGEWTVGESKGTPFAVSSRCRHQFADLSKGAVDADGCLVCPWHASKYDPHTGQMVEGPKGFLGYEGPTPGYTQLVHAYSKVVPLRTRQVVREAGRLVVRAAKGATGR